MKSSIVKEKTCKNTTCGIQFIPRNPLQSTCSPKCAMELKRSKESAREELRSNAEAFVESITGVRPEKVQKQVKPPKMKRCRCGTEFPASFGRTACSQRCADEAAEERKKSRAKSTENPLAEMRKIRHPEGEKSLADGRKIEDNMHKNTVRKVTQETKELVRLRDGGCVIGKLFPELRCECDAREEVPHHALFGRMADHWPDRNEHFALVDICMFHHRQIHGGISGRSPTFRTALIEYLYEIYGELYPPLGKALGLNR